MAPDDDPLSPSGQKSGAGASGRSLLTRFGIDPFLVFLTITVLVAVIVPARGSAAVVADYLVRGAIALLFFLYGARLSQRAIAAGMLHWRLQLLVFVVTFALFPLVGLGITAVARTWFAPDVVRGLLFVSLLPSTVQSSIAFTSIARGNVPAALCAASASNLSGIVVTPLLVGFLVSGTHGSAFSVKALGDIALQLLLPFVLGQMARPWVGAWIGAHPRLTSIVDRGSILFVVYAAFSEGVVDGIWSRLSPAAFLLLVGLDLLMLVLVLILTSTIARTLHFSKEDEITIVFCGSKKSLAAGIPMANVLFPHTSVGLVVLPLMLFHQVQLFACAGIARRYASRP